MNWKKMTSKKLSNDQTINMHEKSFEFMYTCFN